MGPNHCSLTPRRPLGASLAPRDTAVAGRQHRIEQSFISALCSLISCAYPLFATLGKAGRKVTNLQMECWNFGHWDCECNPRHVYSGESQSVQLDLLPCKLQPRSSNNNCDILLTFLGFQYSCGKYSLHELDIWQEKEQDKEASWISMTMTKSILSFQSKGWKGMFPDPSTSCIYQGEIFPSTHCLLTRVHIIILGILPLSYEQGIDIRWWGKGGWANTKKLRGGGRAGGRFRSGRGMGTVAEGDNKSNLSQTSERYEVFLGSAPAK